ncbi:MAG: hypothetical protein ABSE42_14325 [Bryobacteraceae bacterium]|jgi:hypothetical protein
MTKQEADIPFWLRLAIAGFLLLFFVSDFLRTKPLTLAWRMRFGAVVFLIPGGLFPMNGKLRWILAGIGIGLLLASWALDFYLPGGVGTLSLQ